MPAGASRRCHARVVVVGPDALRHPRGSAGLHDRRPPPALAHRRRARLPLVLGVGPPLLGLRPDRPGEAGASRASPTMAALAGDDARVRVGCLVFCVGYRNPGVLRRRRSRSTTLSGGRCELGIGAGWNEREFRAFGMPFLPIKDRLDQLEETAIVLRRLLRRRARHARGQAGARERRGLRAAAGAAAPAALDRRAGREAPAPHRRAPRRRLERAVPRARGVRARGTRRSNDWCEKERRDPRAIIRTVNVGLAIGADEARAQRAGGEAPAHVRRHDRVREARASWSGRRSRWSTGSAPTSARAPSG